MARENKKGGKIVLVSSTLGYMSFVGFASYAPAKHALLGMSITNLFLNPCIDMHCRSCGHTSVGVDVVRR
jgi:3-dehydrosphinganine reductase